MTSFSYTENTSKGDLPQEPMFTSGGCKPSAEELSKYEVLAVAVRCSHGNMLLSRLHGHTSPTSGLWLPYIVLKKDCRKLGPTGAPNSGVALLGQFLLREVNQPTSELADVANQTSSPPPFEKISVHSLTRIQLPNGRFFSRLIYLGSWSADVACCQQSNSTTTNNNLIWAPVSGILNSSASKKNNTDSNQQTVVSRLWGSEVTIYAGILASTSKMRSILDCSNGYRLTLTEVTLDEHVLKYVQRQSKLGPLEAASTDGNDAAAAPSPNGTTLSFIEHVSAAKYTEAIVLKLYSDFVQHCYPATSMTLASYRAYAATIKLDVYLSDEKLASAFQASNYKAKGYLTFNEFLLGLVSLDPGSVHNRARYSFVFRYYNSAGDGALSRADMSRLLADTRTFAQWKMPDETALSLAAFVEEVTTERLKGTSALCRSKRSIVKLIKDGTAYELIRGSAGDAVAQLEATCTRCRPKTYSLAVHTLDLSHLSSLHNPKDILGSDLHYLTAPEDGLSSLKRAHSREFIFSRTAVAGYVLEIVRKLRHFNRMPAERQSAVREQVNRELTSSLLNALCDQVSEVLSVESRVLQVATPTFVMGDIHGNINDLLTFEQQLWPMAPAAQTANVLFLGDYVDRGEFGIEVVCYLFAMKLLAPTRFFLLRGNHEIRQIQRNFTFEKECIDKYGKVAGLAIFEKFNSAFDFLPFSATIDESIFCAHGGIPFSVQTIDGLNQLPGCVSEPEKEAPSIWEVM